MLKLQDVISVLNAKPKGNGWQAYCPVHEASGQHNPSLSISRGSKGQEVVFACQSQHCDQKATYATIRVAEKNLGVVADRTKRWCKSLPESTPSQDGF
jgi:hypothetical protein